MVSSRYLAVMITFTFAACVMVKAQQPAYDLATAQKLVQFAEAAYFCRYDDDCTCTDCSSPPVMSDVRSFSGVFTDAYAYVALSDELNATVVSFSGTSDQSLQNIATDALAGTVNYDGCEDGCQVHLGFQTAYSELRRKIRRALNSDTFKDKPIFVTGHSLGGALSTLCVMDLIKEGYPVIAGYTFGQPRVGDRDFVREFTRTLGDTSGFFRVVHDADPVPLMLYEDQTIFDFDYEHVPHEIFYTGDDYKGARQCNDEDGEDPDCSLQFQDRQEDGDFDYHMEYMGQAMGVDDPEEEVEGGDEEEEVWHHHRRGLLRGSH